MRLKCGLQLSLASTQPGKGSDRAFMPPIMKKFRGHIGLGPSICPSVRYAFVGCKTREPLELGIFFSVGPCMAKLCPFFDSTKNLINTIT